MKKKITFLCVIGFANVPQTHSYYINKYADGYESCVIAAEHHSMKNLNYSIKSDYILADHDIDSCRRDVIPILKATDIFIFCNEFGTPGWNRILNYFPDLENHISNSLLVYYQVNQPLIKRITPLTSKYDTCIFTPDAKKYYEKESGIVVPGCPVEIPKNINKILEDRLKNKNIVIGHIPSCPINKGSKFINKAIEKLKKTYSNIKYIYKSNISNEECLNIKEKCDIYIDQFSRKGGFGTSSFEALTYGCITICTMSNVVDKHKYPIINIDYEVESLYDCLNDLCKLSKVDLNERSKSIINQVKENFALENYINYFIKIFDIDKKSTNRSGFILPEMSLFLN
jgi:hypothetical protein